MNTPDHSLDAALDAYCTAPKHRDGFLAELESTMSLVDLEIAGSPGRQRRSRSRRRLLAGLAAAAAVIAVLAALVVPAVRDSVREVGHSVREFQDPPPASAAERVAANVHTALGNVRTISADVTEYFKVVQGPPPSEWKEDWTTADWWARARIYSDEEFESLGLENGSPFFPTQRVVLIADGKWYEDCPDNPIYVGDDAAGLASSIDVSALSKDTPLGEPDHVDGAVHRPLDYLPQQWAIDLLARGEVGRTEYEGRPALTVTCAIAPMPIKGLNMDAHQFDSVRFTVDPDLWLVVCTDYLLRGRVILQDRLTNVRVNEAVSAKVRRELSRLSAEEDGAISRHFRRVTFGDAARASSTTPMQPTVAPTGFRPFAAAVADHAKFRWYSYGKGRRSHYWPPSRDVTQLSYRAGCLQFLVTTRAQPAADEPLPSDLIETDPFLSESEADGGLNFGEVQTLKLTGGAWKGVTAYLVTPLLDSPHLWAWRDGVLVTIGGDLTVEQLVAIANSLQPME